MTKAALFSNTNTKKNKNFKSPRPILRKVKAKCADSPTVQTFTNFYNYGSSSFFLFSGMVHSCSDAPQATPFPPPPPFQPPVTTCHAKWVHVPKWHHISIQAIELCPFRTERGCNGGSGDPKQNKFSIQLKGHKKCNMHSIVYIKIYKHHFLFPF